MNKAQPLTRYIKHLAQSANFEGGTFNKHRNGLIGNRFEMPNVSYTHPLCATLEDDTTDSEHKNERQIANASAKSKELPPYAQGQPNAAHLLLPNRSEKTLIYK